MVPYSNMWYCLIILVIFWLLELSSSQETLTFVVHTMVDHESIAYHKSLQKALTKQSVKLQQICPFLCIVYCKGKKITEIKNQWQIV